MFANCLILQHVLTRFFVCYKILLWKRWKLENKSLKRQLLVVTKTDRYLFVNIEFISVVPNDTFYYGKSISNKYHRLQPTNRLLKLKICYEFSKWRHFSSVFPRLLTKILAFGQIISIEKGSTENYHLLCVNDATFLFVFRRSFSLHSSHNQKLATFCFCFSHSCGAKVFFHSGKTFFSRVSLKLSLNKAEAGP